jgi:hypothetical protein
VYCPEFSLLSARAFWCLSVLSRVSPLEHGSFEQTSTKTTVSIQEESLSFFVLRLLERLRAQGTAPAADLMKYGRHLDSFKKVSLREL